MFRNAGDDRLFVKLNLGDHFSAPVEWAMPTWAGIPNVNPPDWQVLGNAEALAYSRNQTYSGSLGVRVCFILCVGVSGFWSENRTDSHLSFDDIDGDGIVEHVLKLDGDPNVYIKRNRLEKTNLLRRIERPLGGEITLDYERQGNLVDYSSPTDRVDIPQNQWGLGPSHDDGRLCVSVKTDVVRNLFAPTCRYDVTCNATKRWNR